MPSILIADDSEDLRKVLAWLLQPRGYDILEAATGTDFYGVAGGNRSNRIGSPSEVT